MSEYTINQFCKESSIKYYKVNRLITTSVICKRCPENPAFIISAYHTAQYKTLHISACKHHPFLNYSKQSDQKPDIINQF